MNSDQISVVVDGRDIVLTLPNAEEIRLLEMAEGSRYYWGVRYVDFADDTTFTLTDLANLAVAIQKQNGQEEITGTGRTSETYYHALGDGSYTITDEGAYNKADRLVFTDLNSADVLVAVAGDDFVLTLPNDEVITLTNMVTGSLNYWGVRYIDFLDVQGAAKSRPVCAPS